MKKVRRYARLSGKEATALFRAISKSVLADILNGTYKGMCCRCLMETVPFRRLTHTHTQAGLWDIIIAHPPCTFLTVAGNSWFDVSKYGDKAKQRYKERYQAIVFFMRFALARANVGVAVENPVGIMSTAYRKPDCIIQPWQFGHKTRKATALWLNGLPPLKPTKIVEPEIVHYKNGKGTDDKWHIETLKLPPDERRRARSKFFVGWANAMAEQWGGVTNDSFRT